MKSSHLKPSALLIAALFTLLGCSGDGGSPTGPSSSPPPAAPPPPPPPPTPSTGSLSVSVSESGADLDMNGYVVRVDMAAGGEVWGHDPKTHKIAAGATTTYAALSAGSHTVDLVDVWDNCSVVGGASRNVEIVSGGSEEISFAVSCEEEASAEIDVSGSWEGRFTITDTPGDSQLELEQDGDLVSGSYNLTSDGGLVLEGEISGRISERRVILYTDFPGGGSINPGRIYWRLNASAAADEMTGRHEWDGHDVGNTQLEKQ